MLTDIPAPDPRGQVPYIDLHPSERKPLHPNGRWLRQHELAAPVWVPPGEEAPWGRSVPAPAVPAREAALTQAARDVLAERERQTAEEGWTPEHDDTHQRGEIALAAACYAVGSLLRFGNVGDWIKGFCKAVWPWPRDWWKPTSHRRNLVKAGALILAEIERLDRAALATEDPAHAD